MPIAKDNLVRVDGFSNNNPKDLDLRREEYLSGFFFIVLAKERI